MKKIESFQVDHERLQRGLFVSRIDTVGSEKVTTFDIRMKAPNKEAVMDVAEIHTLEHIGATFLRSHETWSEKVIYFGPMGCRTGFYLILGGLYDSAGALPLVQEMYQFIASFKGDIPGATAVECGNYSDQDLNGANREADKFYREILANPKEDNLNYPS